MSSAARLLRIYDRPTTNAEIQIGLLIRCGLRLTPDVVGERQKDDVNIWRPTVQHFESKLPRTFDARVRQQRGGTDETCQLDRRHAAVVDDRTVWRRRRQLQHELCLRRGGRTEAVDRRGLGPVPVRQRAAGVPDVEPGLAARRAAAPRPVAVRRRRLPAAAAAAAAEVELLRLWRE